MNSLGLWPTSLIIGDSVTIMYDNFKSHTTLRNITIGKNVTHIRAEAFGDCKNLKAVTSYAKEPPFCYPNVFKNKPADAVLTVYASAADAYREAAQWKDFIIQTMPDPRDGIIEDLKALYKEYAVLDFPIGTESGQYGKEAVKAFNTAKFNVSMILISPEDYTDDEIQAALDELKATYQAVLDSKVEGFTIIDGIDLAITEEKTYSHLAYTRTFSSTAWEPLCVPVALSYEDWADKLEMADINMFHQYDTDGDGKLDLTELEVNTITEGSLEPNGLYLVRAKESGECSITVGNGIVYPTAEESFSVSNRKNDYTFSSTYSEVAKSNVYTMQDGELVLNTSATVQPQRWYMTITPRGTAKADAPARIRIRTTQEIVDGIDRIGTTSKTGEMYDLQGRRVLKPTKGLYIQNGKKIIK